MGSSGLRLGGFSVFFFLAVHRKDEPRDEYQAFVLLEFMVMDSHSSPKGINKKKAKQGLPALKFLWILD